jgi:hypothetical protein
VSRVRRPGLTGLVLKAAQVRVRDLLSGARPLSTVAADGALAESLEELLVSAALYEKSGSRAEGEPLTRLAMAAVTFARALDKRPR